VALLDETRFSTRTRAPRWPTADDDALIRGASAGDDGAFEEIFARYNAPLVRYCRGILLDDDAAQDAAQNALAAALRALQAGRSTPRVLGPWLYRIAQREAFDISRRRRREAAARQHHGPDGEDALLSIAAPNDERVRERLRDLVGDLARLPLRQRSALLLRELSGLGYGDIAVALETTPDAARQSVMEARLALVDAGAGRQDSCGDVRALLDSGDRRRLRGRRVRSHLSDCTGCRDFAASLDTRRHDLALLFPLGPALASGGGALAVVTGGGVAAGGAGVAASGWSLGLGGLGASGAAKCALACTAALVGVGSIAETVVVHPPGTTPKVRVVAQAPQPTGTGAASASAAPTPSRTVRSSTLRSSARHPARTAKPRRGASLAIRMPVRSESVSVGQHTAPVAAPAPKATPAPSATTPATATTSAPATTATTATTPAKVATPNPAKSAVGAELQRRTQEAVAKITTEANTAVKQVVETSVQTVQKTLGAVQETVQKATTAALTGVQAQLEAVRRLLKPPPSQP
jgi:RNA polymerase sigma factor (sigma-70 family)